MVERYEPLNIRYQDGKETARLDTYLTRFLEDNGRIVQVVVGDYGTGKTTSVSHLFYTLAKAAIQEGYVGRLPCLIPLQRFNFSGTSPSLILDWLASSVGVRNVLYDSFDAMNKAGLLTLILDGFDEMAKRVTRQVREECFRAVGDLSHARNKVILTGRPGFFPDHTQMLAAVELASSADFMPGILRRNKLRSSVEVANIEPLSDSQILSFLSKRCEGEQPGIVSTKVTELFKKLKAMYNLKELATRPILLEMIAARSSDIASGTVGNVADLYALYTTEWLTADAKKGGFRTLITPEDRLPFSIRLAWGMTADGLNAVHFSDLPDVVARHFGLEEQEDIDHFASDVRTCTFLIRTDDGDYSFAHKSFQEYFCARYVACVNSLDEIRIERYDLDHTEMERISDLYDRSPNTFLFLGGILKCPLSPVFWKRLAAGEDEFGAAIDEQCPGFEDSGSVVEALASGDIPIEEISEIIDSARILLAGLKRMRRIFSRDKKVRGWKAALVKDVAEWL